MTKIMDLESEVIKLKAENEKLRSMLVESNSSSKNENTAAISIHFKNQELYNLHRRKLKRLFEKFNDYEVITDDSKFIITVTENDCIIIEDNEVVKHSVSKKRKSNDNEEEENQKRRKIEIRPEEEDFVLDTTPSFNTDSNLKYESKFSTIKSDESVEEKLDYSKPSKNCFNCGEDHILRECPTPKNAFKINAARQAMKRDQQPKNVRYHLEKDEFGHLKPGKLSKSLKNALQVRGNELPEYIYRMRKLGYPPGWLQEISPSESDLVVFGFDGETDSAKKTVVKEFDADLIIEYPGFNVPMESMVKDDYKYFGCPSFSIAQSKINMLQQLNEKTKVVVDNSEECDMDLSSSFDEEDEKEIRCVSPTLMKLKLERKKLMDQLNTHESFPDMEECDEDNSQESFLTNDNVEEINPKIDVPTIQIKTSALGTPILGSLSSYSKLPSIENFAKNVSPLLLVENLPESKGKFDQLNGIINKIRKSKRTSL